MKILHLLILILLPSIAVAQDGEAQYRARCLDMLVEFDYCYDEGTAEDRALLEELIRAFVATAPPPGDGGAIDPPVDPPEGVLIGMQPAMLADFYPLRPWSNLMHGAGPWRTASGGRELVDVDAIGNPLAPANASIKSAGFSLPAGPYRLTHDGGVVNLVGDFVSLGDGSYTLGRGSLAISTDGNARNIRLSNVDGSKYQEAVVGPVRGRLGVLRVMGFQNTTNGRPIEEGAMQDLWRKLANQGVAIPVYEQTPETFLKYDYQVWEPLWSERTLPSHTRWSAREGVPVEEIFALCRELEVRAAWITVPLIGNSTKDKDYARSLGALCASEWAGELFVEIGNEWWNAAFAFDDMALVRSSTVEGGAATIQSETWIAFREGYVAAGGQRSNLQWSVMGWIIQPGWLRRVLAAMPGEMPDMIGPSFYLPDAKAQARWKEAARADPELPGFTGRTILDDVERTGWPLFYEGLEGHARLAETFGLRLGSYEGNLSMILRNLSNVPRLNKLVFEAHADPYAGELFTKMLQAQVDLGFTTICAFSWMHSSQSAKDGLFGLWSETGDPRPAAEALLEYSGN